jgi:hypothetical protein
MSFCAEWDLNHSYLRTLDELDNAARELNISRQAVIKKLVRQALDQHYLASARQSTAKQRLPKCRSR